MSQERLIKKYANRRLYDSSQSRHITLDDIRGLIVKGERIKVVEDKTGHDITRHILLQVIAEQEQFGRPILSTKVLDELYLDHAFVGTFSLSLDAGLTTTDPAEAFTKEHVLAHTREAVLLVDGSKLGTRSFAHAGRLDQIDVVITDDELDEEASQTFEHAGIRVLVA